MEENKFWRPPSPLAPVKSKVQRVKDAGENLQNEMKAAKRVKFLEQIDSWEAEILKGLLCDFSKEK